MKDFLGIQYACLLCQIRFLMHNYTKSAISELEISTKMAVNYAFFMPLTPIISILFVF